MARMTPGEIRRARRSRRYQWWRRQMLAQGQLLCRLCQDEGRTMTAAELDHIVPAAQAPERFWDATNVQPLCRAHHKEKTAAEHHPAETPARAAWRRRLEEWRGETPA